MMKINKLMAIGIILLFFHLPIVATTGATQISDLGEKTPTEIVKESEKKVEQPMLNSYESVWERGFSSLIKNNFSYKSTYTPHFPIRIYDNDDFTKRNGVVAGNGTKENPYIIEGWEIKGNLFWKMINRILYYLEHLVLGSPWDLASLIRNWARNIPVCGVCLRNTNKHVVIRNNYMHDWKAGYPRDYVCPSGIIIINASNITIENNVIEKNTRGIYMANIQLNQDYESTNITIRFNNLMENGDLAIRAYYTYNSSITYNNITENGGGVYSFYSHLYIAYNNVFDNGNGIICSEGSIIENNFIAGNGNGIYCTNSDPEDFNGSNSIIANNTIVGNAAGIFVSPGYPIILNNTITDNDYGILCMGNSKQPMIIVDNIISNNSCGINSVIYGPAIIKHNLITSNGEGIGFCGKAFIEYNIIKDNGDAISASASGENEFPIIHYNNIFGNKQGIRYVETIWNVTINATYNWWGSADGPSGYGNGHGDEVDKNIIYDPWLTEPNPDAGPR